MPVFLLNKQLAISVSPALNISLFEIHNVLVSTNIFETENGDD